MSLVKMADVRPCSTEFWMAIASSSVLYFITYRIGAKVSSPTIGMSGRAWTRVGSTKKPGPASRLPP